MDKRLVETPLKGMLSIVALCGLGAFFQLQAKWNAPVNPPSCEQLRKQFADPDADCEELQSRYQTAVSFSNFPG